MLEVKLQRISEDAIVPDRAYSDAAGFDLYSIEQAILPPGGRRLIRTGWNIQLPPGTEGQVRPRSGLALKHGITVLNSPGTIDADYRGEIGVVLINHGSEPFQVEKGSKIAQLVFATVAPAGIEVVGELEDSQRGARGYGSTGS